MEIKIDINLNVQNINQIIDKLSCLINKNIPNTSIEDKSDFKSLNNKSIENLSIDDIRNKISSLSQIGKVSKAKEILSKYNATKVSQINNQDYEKIYNELNCELSN